MSQHIVSTPCTRALYLAWSILAFLSLCLGLPALAVGTLASQILIHRFGLLWLNDTTIGSFGGATFSALVTGAILVGGAVALFQGFILQRELHMPLHSWRAWSIYTAVGWSIGLCVAVIVSLPLGRYLYQTLSEPFVPLVEGSLIGLCSGLIVGSMQWLVLRHTARHAWYWIVATVLGWIIGWVLVWSTIDSFFSNWGIS